MFFQKNISLRKLHTFGIDIKCKIFCRVKSETDILDLLISDEFTQNRTLILGGGSNLLFTKNYNGLIIKNEILGKSIISESENTTTVKVGAGEDWHKFVLWSIDNKLSGIENMALIPGSVGAAPMQNIGAYGVEVKNVIENVWAINIKDGKKIIFSNSDCNFEYRDSIFKNELRNKIIITHVSFNLNKTPNYNTQYGDIESEIKNLGMSISTKSIFHAVVNIRNRKLPNPAIIGNSGSFFKNPIISNKQFKKIQKEFPEIVAYRLSQQKIKIAAAWMIDSCGWKGYRKGDAGVHKKQALVLVNFGNATGREIISISKKIQDSVHHKFGIEIKPEVNII